MKKDEIFEILVEEYGLPGEDLKGKTYKELNALLSVEKRKAKHTFLSNFDGECDPEDEADLFPNGRDFDAEDEDDF